MKSRTLFLVIGLPWTLVVAQAPPNGVAVTHGSCTVAHTGNSDTIYIQNCGIGKAQGDKIISLLNELLTGRDLETVNDKLDELLKIVRDGQARRLSSVQIEGLKRFLTANSSEGFVGVTYNSSDRDTMIYAKDFISVFAGEKWPAQGSVVMSSTAPEFGILLDISPSDKNSPPQQATNMIHMLRSIGIPCEGRLWGLVQKGHYGIEIGLKPPTT